ncbi:YrhC family protein [Oceanobacillus halotolerans]|uniref:YrhC family protein n=1 Tax=Oceanobacillus halotolerans TaxID=2663380 RepID=UPI0013DA0607|nr:YrhC family protein [Oceanobacillus halotolerans]
MNVNKDDLLLKLKDYQRFLVTLLILASYLYMGAIINTYIQPNHHSPYLYMLSLILIVLASIFLYKTIRIRKELQD